MSTRVFILLGVLVACVLVISSEVSARELAEEQDATSTATTESNDLNNAKYGGGYPGGGGGGYPGGGGGGYHGGGGGGYPGGGHGRGRGCYYGCCGRGRGYNYGGCRCCTYAGEAAEIEPEAKPQN